MHAVSACLRKHGLMYDDLYDPYHHLDIKEALARRPRQVCLVPSPRIASSRPTASSARSSWRRGARLEGMRGSTDPSCSSSSPWFPSSSSSSGFSRRRQLRERSIRAPTT